MSVAVQKAYTTTYAIHRGNLYRATYLYTRASQSEHKYICLYEQIVIKTELRTQDFLNFPGWLS